MKSLKNGIKKFFDAKKTYDEQYRSLADKIHKMPITDINKFLSGIQCRYSYDKDAHFQINESEEKNSNCTFDTVYEFNCVNCETRSQCYYGWKGRKRYSKKSVIDFLIDMCENS